MTHLNPMLSRQAFTQKKRLDRLSCRSSLFGGTCVATVLLSTEVPSTLPPATHIAF